MLIEELIGKAAPADYVLLAADRKPLTYAGLRSQSERTRTTLRDLGFREEDRIALVLPNGPELAVAFLSISGAAAVAPLNPAYSINEFRFYMGDLGTAALATAPGFCAAAEEAAESLDIPVLSLVPSATEPAGTFDLQAQQRRRTPGKPQQGDGNSFALLLHSSGTTAKPKLVGLTHANLCASARSIAAALRLRPEDRALNIMPLFHIHGLVGCLLSSLSAGASVYCSPGFNALQFGRWMREAEPTWYSAVPTMHQALLGRASEIVRNMVHPLRFVRSSSAHLETRVWLGLESYFECPALNAYGMTEAAHQIATNPLPPAERRYGSVGHPAGPDARIVDEKGELESPGATGEIAIRGPSVIQRYLQPVEVNQAAFANGWLRTGDQGVIDSKGYVFITGRIKELINVGGEKISPAEIDAVLMQHPAVTQAVTFGASCESRGERICSAVVLESEATETDLKTFVRERLARFKTPSTVLIVEDIPKGPTGKIQRIGMARRLGLE
jgi:oxalate---CoA ligase